MSKKKIRPSQPPIAPPRARRRQRRVAIIVGIVLLLSLTGGLLAQWRATGGTNHPNSVLTPMPTPTPAPISLSKEYIYAGGKLIATEEPSNVSVAVTAPAALAAATYSETRIDLNWTASTGPVDHYEIERSTSVSGPYTLLPSQPTTNSFTDTIPANGKGIAYLYHVRAVDTNGHYSPYSNIDVATAVTFLDDPFPTNAPTAIKAQHVTELRDAINAVRVLAGLPPVTWVNSSLAGVRIQARHVQDMRDALDQALSALGLPVQAYLDQNLTNVRIQKEHFRQLRARVK